MKNNVDLQGWKQKHKPSNLNEIKECYEEMLINRGCPSIHKEVLTLTYDLSWPWIGKLNLSKQD